MVDTFVNVEKKDNPADRWFAITPSGTAFPIIPRGLICVATGDVTLVDVAGTSMPLTAVAAGTVIPLRPNKVTAATGTFYGLY